MYNFKSWLSFGLILFAVGGGGAKFVEGAQWPPSTNFAAHTKPLRFQPRHFKTSLKSYGYFDTKLAKIRHSVTESQYDL